VDLILDLFVLLPSPSASGTIIRLMLFPLDPLSTFFPMDTSPFRKVAPERRFFQVDCLHETVQEEDGKRFKPLFPILSSPNLFVANFVLQPDLGKEIVVGP